MELDIFQIDAFTDRVFGGNPAAVIVLDVWLDDAIMQRIALENNLSETVFVVLSDSGNQIRWFTPTIEVDLCGHATLAAAYVLFNYDYISGSTVNFQSKSGVLSVESNGDLLSLDFPSRPATNIVDLKCLHRALGIEPLEAFQSRDTMAVFSSQEEIEAISPDFELVKNIDTFAIIVTAPGNDCDFVSRFFAPAAGVLEDPVTGSAHCTLAPYWANRLNKESLVAKQLSKRGGKLFCRARGDRVIISGNSVAYMRGKINI
ncbi:MAG: PhzF family phenazine biosynthesis protein [Gammaproteobacteria bacterium]|nr:PhzF family phenazine biosynthesis protein [Gammaproteobacteria bacterium]